MPDPIKRTEKVHIDELSCKATSTVQWFLENRSTTHPVTHNNELEVFICGEKAFADIAEKIKAAKQSIDICCWGFDPGMELVRGGPTWPRGETYGDLLIAAGKRKVKIRLLVWYSKVGSPLALNMPGHSHGNHPWRCVGGSNEADKIGARRSVSLIHENYKKPAVTLFATGTPSRATGAARPITAESLTVMAREEYCHSWYEAAFAGLLEGITIQTRAGDPAFIEKSLASEKYKPGGVGELEVERTAMVRIGTHHQKTLLIDYNYMGGAKAVGYVKGLNSVTDYWDTEDHVIEDPKRECGGERENGEAVQVDEGKKADSGFKTFKPYRDYACRISGAALASVHANFVRAWGRAGGDTLCDDLETIPSALRRTGIPGSHSSIQIIRTQPEEQDKTAKEMYFLATDTAANATGYLYIENQYLQYQEWAERLIQARKNVMARWKAAGPATGKTKGDMPLLHVFIVMPVAERGQMVPRTYDTLAVLGQQAGMTGQSALIDKENKRPHRPESRRHGTADGRGLYEANGRGIRQRHRQAEHRCTGTEVWTEGGRGHAADIRNGRAPHALSRNLHPLEIAAGRRFLFQSGQRELEPAQHGGRQRNQPGDERCQAGEGSAAKDLGEIERRYGRWEEWFACGDCTGIQRLDKYYES